VALIKSALNHSDLHLQHTTFGQVYATLHYCGAAEGSSRTQLAAMRHKGDVHWQWLWKCAACLRWNDEDQSEVGGMCFWAGVHCCSQGCQERGVGSRPEHATYVDCLLPK
jgi:hypothetical protein